MKPKNQINFTVKNINSLPIPGKGKRSVYFDNKISGLNIIITDRGTKTFYLRKVINGISRRIRIGRFPDLSVENARSKAESYRSAIAKDENIFELLKEKKKEPTLNDFFDQEFYIKHSKIYKKSHIQDKRQYDLYFRKKIGSYKLSEITKFKIKEIHHDIGNNAKYSANRSLSLIRVIYNKAIEWGFYRGDNPANHIKPFKEKSRDRFLKKDEIPKFFVSLEQEKSQDIKDYVWLSILTGARRSNILSMKWKDIDFKDQEWRIPETKNGEPQTVPLVDRAVDILKARKKSVKYVFPGKGKTGHMVEPKKGWKRVLDRARIENLRLHDLRRTLGSYQALLGTSINIIGKSLGHKNLQTSQIYARLDLDPVRDSINNATDFIMKLMESEDGS